MPNISYKMAITTKPYENNIYVSQLEISIVSNAYNFETIGNYGDYYVQSLDQQTLTSNSIYVKLFLDSKQEIEIDEVIKKLVLIFNVKIM
jgi:hypothetical protein